MCGNRVPFICCSSADASLADELYHFYAYFKANSAASSLQAHAAEVSASDREERAITVSEHGVKRALRRVNTWKATDGVLIAFSRPALTSV